MGEDNGLTLQALAQRLERQTQRLETLERENEKMRSENDTLQSKVATLEGSEMPRGDDEVAKLRSSGTPPTEDGKPPASEWSGFEGKVSRRGLLSKASKAGVAAAAGLVVAGALTQRDIREAKADPTVFTTNTSGAGAVEGRNLSTDGIGVYGQCQKTGVLGYASTGNGVYGQGEANGVRGLSGSNGYGVSGEGKAGVVGKSYTNGYEGVYGQHTGSAGYGVVGDGTGSSAGVLGRNPSGPGIEGRDSKYGGKFAGSQAQLLLVPKGTAGRPTSGTHTKGELYIDSAAALFVCAASGTPGTWRKVTTTAV
jgi:hypothetical protein